MATFLTNRLQPYESLDSFVSAKPLAGKTAFVTGAGKGVGEHIARELAGAGAARIGLLGRDRARIEAARARFAAAFPATEFVAFAADVTDEAAVAAAFAAFGDGAPDILVSNAGAVPGRRRLRGAGPGAVVGGRGHERARHRGGDAAVPAPARGRGGRLGGGGGDGAERVEHRGAHALPADRVGGLPGEQAGGGAAAGEPAARARGRQVPQHPPGLDRDGRLRPVRGGGAGAGHDGRGHGGPLLRVGGHGGDGRG
jgi:hypothetical protein